MDNKIAIVIPIYKETLENHEKLSLHRIYLLYSNKYDIYFLTYYNLLDNFENYKKIIFSYTTTNYNFIVFEKNYFKSKLTYNLLMTKIDLYNHLLDYDYMLLYQLDCYIFKDNLEYWADMNLPQIECIYLNGNDKITHFNGNGLRNIKQYINFLKTHESDVDKLWHNCCGYILSKDNWYINDYCYEDLFFTRHLSKLEEIPQYMYLFGWSTNQYDNFKKYGIPTMIHYIHVNISYNKDNDLDEIIFCNKFVLDYIGDYEYELKKCINSPKFIEMNL